MSVTVSRADNPRGRTHSLRMCSIATIGVVIATLIVVLTPSVASAATPIADVNLGTAASFSSVSTGALTVGAGAGVAGSAVVGEGAASSLGAGASVGAAVAGIAQAQADVGAAYVDAASRVPTGSIAGDIGSLTFVTGVYSAGAAAVSSTGTVTFDAQGNPDAVFIFQIDAAFNAAAATSMVLINGAQARHVYWQVLGAVTIGAAATFVGTIIARGAVTAGAETKVSGRTFSTQGAVSLGAGMDTLGVPEISLSNSASPKGTFFDGETITYTFVASNSGNVALTVGPLSLSGVDAISPLSYVWAGTPGTLLPKESVTITGTYLATFADAVQRSVTASAGVGGLSFPNGTSGAESERIQVIAVRSTTVTVWPIPVADTVTAVEGIATTFDVFTNDQTLADIVGFSRTQLTPEPRPIGAAASIVPASPIFGSVTCSDSGPTEGLCTYQSAALFSGTDHFDYSVSQLGRSWNVHVTVLVTPAIEAPTVRSDRAVATAGGPTIALAPLANDVGDEGQTLTIVSADAVPGDRGVLACSAHSCSFTPSTSGFVGTVVSEYRVSNESSAGIVGATSSGTITIFVDAPAATKQGFTSSPSSEPKVDAGVWTDTSAMGSPHSRCVSGRPETTVAWTANARATSWTLERRESPHGAAVVAEWTPIAVLPGASSSFQDHRVGESTDFQYRVRPDRYRWKGTFSDVSSTSVTPDAVSAAGC